MKTGQKLFQEFAGAVTACLPNHISEKSMKCFIDNPEHLRLLLAFLADENLADQLTFRGAGIFDFDSSLSIGTHLKKLPTAFNYSKAVHIRNFSLRKSNLGRLSIPASNFSSHDTEGVIPGHNRLSCNVVRFARLVSSKEAISLILKFEKALAHDLILIRPATFAELLAFGMTNPDRVQGQLVALGDRWPDNPDKLDPDREKDFVVGCLYDDEGFPGKVMPGVDCFKKTWPIGTEFLVVYRR
jgi:hypothetical protein